MRKVKLVSLGLSGLIFGGILIGGNEAIASSETNIMIQKQKDNAITFEIKYAPYFYKWKEPGLKEEDFMQRVDLNMQTKFGRFFLRPEFSLYGGNVDYDGQTMSGTPVKTGVTYTGFRVELKGGYTFQFSPNCVFPVYVALGLEKWKRALDSIADDSTTTENIGYTEKWKTYYGKIGVSPIKKLGNYYIYGDAYLKFPFETKNKVDFFDVEVKPKNKLGYGIEIGFGVKNFLKRNLNGELGFFYEYDKFGKSSIKEGKYLGQPISLYQPESKRELFGIKAGIEF